MNDTEKLAVLAETIAKHAREVVGRQWADIVDRRSKRSFQTTLTV